MLPVYGDRGGGNEVNGKIETGLLGVAAAPDFGTTGHVYLQYVPTFNPDNPVHAGMADGDAAPDHEDGAGADLALHDQPARPRSSISTPRS